VEDYEIWSKHSEEGDNEGDDQGADDDITPGEEVVNVEDVWLITMFLEIH
jgi:hypothetical protein